MQAVSTRIRQGNLARPATVNRARTFAPLVKQPVRASFAVCHSKKKGKKSDGAEESSPNESEVVPEQAPEEPAGLTEEGINEAVEEVESAVVIAEDVAAAAGSVAEDIGEIVIGEVTDAVSSGVDAVEDKLEEVVPASTKAVGGEESKEGPEVESPPSEETAAVSVPPVSPPEEEGWSEATSYMASDEMSVEELKAALLDSLYMTERGLAAGNEVRSEIHEIICQLEGKCPTTNPTENLEMMGGTWKLMYTSNSPLIAVLALGKLPLVTVGDITQSIDAASLTCESKVELSNPLAKTAVTASASIEVRSPKRLQLQLEKGVFKTPELLTDLTIPDSLYLMGNSVDLTQLKSALEPVNEGVMSFLTQVNDVLSKAPEVEVPLAASGTQSWQLNTYLDKDTRIARGDGGSIFLYVKENPEDMY